MNLRWLVTAVLCGAMCLSMAGAATASDGWFGSSSKPAANGVTTTGAKKSWWPSWTMSKPKSKPKSTKSTWSSFSNSTKKTWNKTTSFLNPFDNPPKKSPTTQETAANSSGWFSSPKPEKKEVATLPDFIGQERPKW